MTSPLHGMQLDYVMVSYTKHASRAFINISEREIIVSTFAQETFILPIKNGIIHWHFRLLLHLATFEKKIAVFAPTFAPYAVMSCPKMSALALL